MRGSEDIALVWFRRDLRLDDNPAWAAATSEKGYVVAFYVLDEPLLAAAGPFRRRQLVANLQALDYDLFERTGGRLVVRRGNPVQVVPDAVARLGCGSVYLNADVTPYATRRDDAVEAALDVPVHRWWGNLVHPPGSVLTKKGQLSKVFSAFHRTWAATDWDPWPEPGDAVVFPDPVEPLPRLDAPAPLPEGEGEAHRRLAAFLERVDAYDDVRDVPAADETSHLSADLHFGLLSPRAVVTAVGEGSEGRRALVRQLAWRDWFAHVTAANPDIARREVSGRGAGMAWRDDPGELAAWKGGFTGYPFVDAAMRQLRESGWVHNRARMVAASFLVKDLLVDWRRGERHFRHLLVDGDLAQNAGNWQWVAGTGLDAAPYHRVFNPVVQSRRFDPEGAYIARWVPELAGLPPEARHAPWEASEEDLAAAGVVLGDTYPLPIVDHDEARRHYLATWGDATSSGGGGASEGDDGATAPATDPGTGDTTGDVRPDDAPDAVA